MRAEARYSAAAAGDLVRVELDALTAVYDRRSGQTHLLASPLPEMLEALGEAEWTLDAFADHIRTKFELAADGNATTLIAAHLHELAALGLVEAR